MSDKIPKARSWIKLFLKLTFLILLAVSVSVPLLTVVEYYKHVNKYVFYVEHNNPIEGKKELDKFHYFYDLSKKWKVQWWADQHLFGDSFFYEIADAYLINHWKNIIGEFETHKDRIDDPRAYAYANAKVQNARAMYSGGHKKEAVDFVTDEIHKDYEKALKICLESTPSYLQCYDQVWNYDITDNKKSGEELLKQPKMPPKFILGPLEPDDQGVPKLPPPKEPGGGKLNEKQPGGGGNMKRP